MSDTPTLLKDAIKQIRVARSIIKSYRVAFPNDEINPDHMTPYERGRSHRVADKLAVIFTDLSTTPANVKLVHGMMGYLDGLGFKRPLYGMKKSIQWSNLLQNCLTVNVDSIIHISSMLDIPLSEVPRRFMIMKLGLSEI